MALSFKRCAAVTYCAQYTGSNSADMIAYLDGIYGTGTTTLSGTDILNSASGLVVPVGGWIYEGGYGGMPSAGFDHNFDLLGPDGAQSCMGVSSALAGIGAGQDANVDVALRPGFADTDYTAAAWLVGSVALLGQLTVSSWAVLNATTVRVVVHNGALVTVAGGQLVVSAVHN